MIKFFTTRKSNRLQFGDIIEVNGQQYEVRIISKTSKFCKALNEKMEVKIPCDLSKINPASIESTGFKVIKEASPRLSV